METAAIQILPRLNEFDTVEGVVGRHKLVERERSGLLILLLLELFTYLVVNDRNSMRHFMGGNKRFSQLLLVLANNVICKYPSKVWICLK